MTVGAVSLGAAGALPLPLVGLVLLRDFTLAQGTFWHLRRTERPVDGGSLPVKLEASQLSKANTVLQTMLFFTALLDFTTTTNVMVPVVAATTWISGYQYYRSNPLKELPSKPGITRGQEVLGERVNAMLVGAGFGLFVWCLALPFIKKKPEKD